jgi:hypothetical protein
VIERIKALGQDKVVAKLKAEEKRLAEIMK